MYNPVDRELMNLKTLFSRERAAHKKLAVLDDRAKLFEDIIIDFEFPGQEEQPDIVVNAYAKLREINTDAKELIVKLIELEQEQEQCKVRVAKLMKAERE